HALRRRQAQRIRPGERRGSYARVPGRQGCMDRAFRSHPRPLHDRMMDTTPNPMSLRVLEVGHTPRTAICGYLLAGVGAAVTKLVAADAGPDPCPDRARLTEAES